MSLGSKFTTHKTDINFLNGKTSLDNKHFISSRSLHNPINRRVLKKQYSWSTSSKRVRNEIYPQHQKSFLDIESLNEENLLLKLKFAELENENIALKQRFFNIDNNLKSKNEESIQNLLRNTSQRIIIPDLRQNLAEFKEKLKQKEKEFDEHKAKIRSKKITDAENQIQIHIKECQKLKNLLEQSLMRHQIMMSPSDIEEKYKRNLQEIEDLKKCQLDYQRALDIITKELNTFKGEENILENSYKLRFTDRRKSLKEVKKIKHESILIKQEILIQEKKFQKKEEENIKKINKLSLTLQENIKNLQSLENQLKEKTNVIKEITKENNDIAKILRRTRTMNEKELGVERKLLNPPRFFSKVHEIIKKKNLIIGVYLSLIDKNNRGNLRIDEFCNYFKNSPQKIEKKYIEHALKLMGYNDKYVILSKIEEWYQKYDYSDIDSITSEVSDFEGKSDKLNNKISLETSNEMETETLGPAFVRQSSHFRSLTNVGQTNIDINNISQEVLEVFEEIAIKMEMLGISKSKLAKTLLEINEKSVFYCFHDLERKLKSSKMRLLSTAHIESLLKYIFNHNTELISLQEIQEKLSKSIRDWTVFTKEKILSIKLLIHTKMVEKLPKIRNYFKKFIPDKSKNTLDWIIFKNSLEENEVSLPEEYWHWWSLKFYPDNVVDYKQELQKFKEIFPSEESLKLIKEKIQVNLFTLEELFDSESNQEVMHLKFIKGIQKLNIGLRRRDIYEIIHYLRYNQSSQNDNAFDFNYLKSALLE